MDVSSVAYQRAISTLAKQELSHSRMLPDPEPRVKPTASDLLLTLGPDSALDPFKEAISQANRALVKDARSVISDATMIELLAEDPKAHLSYEDGVRHQIVVNCQHLRIHLNVIDHLMGLYNLSVGSAKAKGKGKAS